MFLVEFMTNGSSRESCGQPGSVIHSPLGPSLRLSDSAAGSEVWSGGGVASGFVSGVEDSAEDGEGSVGEVGDSAVATGDSAVATGDSAEDVAVSTDESVVAGTDDDGADGGGRTSV
ncbi:MAG TPA: hypothetical protein P5159_23155, partial [Phycisphaerae bacterium]|nr:hypothetical protein [Phycisphaerae bacterium]